MQFESTPPHCYKNLVVSSIVVLDEHAHVFAPRAPHSSPLWVAVLWVSVWSLDVLKQSLCSTLAVVCVAPRLSLRGRACASSQMEGRGSKCSLFILALSNEMFTREPKMFARRAIVSPPHPACFPHSVCADVSLRVFECVEPPQSFKIVVFLLKVRPARLPPSHQCSPHHSNTSDGHKQQIPH